MAANEYSADDICWSVGAGLELARKGINPQELLMAPNPDKRPRMMVPNMRRRDNALVMISGGVKPCGRGICAIANSKSMTGIKLITMRTPKILL
jgi:hypothetical protein